MGLNKDLSLLNIKSQNQTSLVVSSYLTTRPDSRGLRHLYREDRLFEHTMI